MIKIFPTYIHIHIEDHPVSDMPTVLTAEESRVVVTFLPFMGDEVVSLLIRGGGAGEGGEGKEELHEQHCRCYLIKQ